MRCWLRIVLCGLLCIGATLDDIDYINAIRAPRTMSNRGSSVADDDSDDQHSHLVLAPITETIDLSAPFLSALYTVSAPGPPSIVTGLSVIRSGRAPPGTTA
jgi:hypothetical protein